MGSYFPNGGMNGVPGMGPVPGMGYPPPGAGAYGNMPPPGQYSPQPQYPPGPSMQGGPNGIAFNGPVDLIIPKPMPGMPATGLPSLMVRPSQPGQVGFGNSFNPSPIPPPSYQVGGQPYAQSFPISTQAPPFPPSPDVLPPFVTAPWLFYTPPQRPAGPGNPNFQNNYYNNYGGGPQQPYSGYPGYPGYGYPNQYPQQGPQPPYAQQPPVKPPQPPQTPPEAKETPKPETPKPEEAKAKEAKDDKAKEETNLPKKPNASTLTDEQVRTLNQQLNDPNATVRSNAAMDLYKILETNPDICNHPTYKPYLDAFMIKILGDPSPLVRQPLLLAFEMGYVQHVTDPVRHLLEKLAKGNGLWNKEPEIIKGILPTLNKPRPTESTDAHPLKGAAAEEEEVPAAAQPVHFGQKFNVISDSSQKNTGEFTSTKSSGQRLNIVSSS